MYSYECGNCLHLNKSAGLTCSAFPDGIPEEIITGERSHSTPYDGDDGIIYMPRPDMLHKGRADPREDIYLRTIVF